MLTFSIHRARKWDSSADNMKYLPYNAVYCKDTPDALEAIRKELDEKGIVEVHNEYETFYGVSFDGWLMKQVLKGIDCEVEVLDYNQWEGYPWTYKITKK